MNNYLVMDAISYLGADMLTRHLKIKERLRNKSKRNINVLRWSAVAVCITLFLCVLPVVLFIFHPSHGGTPISINYANVSEAHKQLGYETLYSKLDFSVATTKSVSVSYQEDGEGNPVYSEPLQLLLRQTYNNGNSIVTANLYVLFNKKDVNDSYIGGYEEQGLSKEINGVKVYYSNIFDGANHTQAKFIHEDKLYVIDLVSSEEIDIDYFLDKILT